jgi:hypothetical protein
MTRHDLADLIEDLDADIRTCVDADRERRLHTALAELIEGDNLRMICAALRKG